MIERLTAPGEAYELVTEDGPRGPQRVFRQAPSSLRRLYEGASSERPFLVHGDERLTFAEALHVSARLAHALVDDLGVRPGDRVAISMRNFPEWMLAFEAVTSVGAKVGNPGAFRASEQGGQVYIAPEKDPHFP